MAINLLIGAVFALVLLKIDSHFGIILEFRADKNLHTFVSIVSSYAFTLLGFLSAFVSILLGFSNTRAVRRYARQGHLGHLCIIIGIAILVLIMLFGSSLLLLARSGLTFWVMLLSCISLFQVAFVVIAVLVVIGKAVGGKYDEAKIPALN